MSIPLRFFQFRVGAAGWALILSPILSLGSVGSAHAQMECTGKECAPLGSSSVGSSSTGSSGGVSTPLSASTTTSATASSAIAPSIATPGTGGTLAFSAQQAGGLNLQDDPVLTQGLPSPFTSAAAAHASTGVTLNPTQASRLNLSNDTLLTGGLEADLSTSRNSSTLLPTSSSGPASRASTSSSTATGSGLIPAGANTALTFSAIGI